MMGAFCVGGSGHGGEAVLGVEVMMMKVAIAVDVMRCLPSPLSAASGGHDAGGRRRRRGYGSIPDHGYQ